MQCSKSDLLKVNLNVNAILFHYLYKNRHSCSAKRQTLTVHLRATTHFLVKLLPLNWHNLSNWRPHANFRPFYFGRWTKDSLCATIKYWWDKSLVDCSMTVNAQLHFGRRSSHTHTHTHTHTPAHTVEVLQVCSSWNCFSYCLSISCTTNIRHCEPSTALLQRLKSPCQAAFSYRSASLREHIDIGNYQEKILLSSHSQSQWAAILWGYLDIAEAYLHFVLLKQKKDQV